MSWGHTKPLRPNDPNFVFTEEDYKKRRCHPNFKEMIDCERTVTKKGEVYPGKLKTYVVCSGLIYGEEEEDLKYFFRTAWFNEKLPIFGTGENFIPLIHIKKLAQVIYGLIVFAPAKPQVILAVEKGPCTYNDIVKCLSTCLGIGKTVNVDQIEAFLYDDVNQTLYDKMTVNLRMMPVFIVKGLNVNPTPNFVENITNIVQEYRVSRKLKALKLLLHGPPAVGKTELAKKLCENYRLHYVNPETAVTEMLEEMQGNSKSLELVRMMESNNGEMPLHALIELLQKLLPKNICQNQGFVLDGFPTTTDEAKALFELHAGEGQTNAIFTTIAPTFVFSLHATDDFICNRVMLKKEEEIKDTKFDEENLIRRLKEFRELNTVDNTILNYFDEIEIHPILIEVNSINWRSVYDRVCEYLGDPGAGLGLTVEEMEQLEYVKQMEMKVQEEKERLESKIDKMLKKKQYQNKMESWLKILEKLQMEEEKILEARSAPLRHYLMKFVFPTLTRGLIEVVKTKPDDPVDFLAEFLFKENPEGKMFDPSFNKEGIELLESYSDM